MKRSNGSGVFARVICPRKGGDARLIISKASAGVKRDLLLAALDETCISLRSSMLLW
jgi:hypothetical protein